MSKSRAGALALLIVGMALGSPALAGVREDFQSACNKRTDGQAVELCTCKADFAVKALDERMLGYVIASMASDATDIPEDVLGRWNDYVAESNRVCKPGY